MVKRIFLKKLFLAVLALAILASAVVFGINLYVKSSTEDKILNKDSSLPTADCILILGCGVKADGTPSNMLEDRLLTGIELYKQGVAPKLLMSGDHSRVTYDEVNIMKNFAVERGVPSADIFMDHAGFSTYESMYRARDIFLCKSVIVVTQEYHLYRSIYNASRLGLDAVGVCADLRRYRGQASREIREILARNKDFIFCIFTPKPTYLGETIPVIGDGNLTND